MQSKRAATLIIAMYPDDVASVRCVIRQAFGPSVVPHINWNAPVATIANDVAKMMDSGRFSPQQNAGFVALLEHDAVQRIAALTGAMRSTEADSPR